MSHEGWVPERKESYMLIHSLREESTAVVELSVVAVAPCLGFSTLKTMVGGFLLLFFLINLPSGEKSVTVLLMNFHVLSAFLVPLLLLVVLLPFLLCMMVVLLFDVWGFSALGGTWACRVASSVVRRALCR